MHESLKEAEYQRFLTMTDEAIAQLAQEKKSTVAVEYLVNKYKNFVKSKARTYFLIGADKEDLIQEGMIGLYKAVRDYRADRQASFRAFADLCITRQIISAVKAATRQKHIPLNSYISLNKPAYLEESERPLIDVLEGAKVEDPEELLIYQEESGVLDTIMNEVLSDFEQVVLISYLDGRSYHEIAEETKKTTKSIDNALQRSKRKLEKYFEERRGR